MRRQIKNDDCPQCGEASLEIKMKRVKLNVQDENQEVLIDADIPFRICETCGFEFQGEESADAEHDAICKYFKLLTSDDIKAIRDEHNMTAAEFADATGLGEASLSRWERRALMQSRANDNYLRLLKIKSNMQYLRGVCCNDPVVGKIVPCFRELRPSHPRFGLSTTIQEA